MQAARYQCFTPYLRAIRDRPLYKTFIDTGSLVNWNRWLNVLNGTRQGANLPPIKVISGNKGIPISQVTIGTGEP